MGLYKICEHKGRARDRCEHAWWGSFRGIRVSLPKWTNREIDSKAAADAALDDLKRAVRNGTFDERGLEPPREVTQPPDDLGPPIRRGRERQDRMVERLGEPVDPAIPVDEAVVGDRVAGREPTGEGRADVPRHALEIAQLCVGSVALGADALGPIVGRGSRRVGGHGPAERIDPRRLVEVAVDDEVAAAHATSGARAARSSAA